MAEPLRLSLREIREAASDTDSKNTACFSRYPIGLLAEPLRLSLREIREAASLLQIEYIIK